MHRELALLDATAQAELVRCGEVSAAELVDASIARIEALNPTLNAVITPLFDKARAAALATAGPDAFFCGVPLLLKDLDSCSAGDPFHAGMRLLREVGWIAKNGSGSV